MRNGKIQGLAWDDDPQYMMNLRESLSNDIELTIKKTRAEFEKSFDIERPDFVLVDLLDEHRQKLGLNIARWVAAQKQHESWYPIFVVTLEPQVMTGSDFELLPFCSTFSFKMDPPWMALRIQEELKRQGTLVEFKRVFLIHADHDKEQYTLPLAKWLNAYGITAHLLIPGDLQQEIAGGLLMAMNKCAAIIAVCTPNDHIVGGAVVPRSNVLLEIGMALALPRGLERLILLAHKSCELPSDLRGVGRIDFAGSVSDTFKRLGTALEKRNVPIPLQ